MARKTTKPTLHAADAGDNPILEEAYLILTLGRRPLKIWVFVANITNQFTLGLDIQRVYGASMGLGRQNLLPAKEEVSLWSPGHPAW
jgi:hypothetical protein